MITYNSKRTHVIDEITRQGHSLISINGEWVSSNDVVVQAIIDSFDELVPAKVEAKARIVEQSQAYMQQVESEYPSFERATWSTQKAEIEAWAIDNNSPTPFLDVIAIARGMDRVTLLNRTLVKVTVYNEQAAFLAGKRQKLEDEIDNSTDLDFISSINFEV
jgi:hypothetical protein